MAFGVIVLCCVINKEVSSKELTNLYNTTPEQIDEWLGLFCGSRLMCHVVGRQAARSLVYNDTTLCTIKMAERHYLNYFIDAHDRTASYVGELETPIECSDPLNRRIGSDNFCGWHFLHALSGVLLEQMHPAFSSGELLWMLWEPILLGASSSMFTICDHPIVFENLRRPTDADRDYINAGKTHQRSLCRLY